MMPIIPGGAADVENPNGTVESGGHDAKGPTIVEAEDAEKLTERASDATADNEEMMKISPHEVKPEDIKQPILIGIADVEQVVETTELCEDAANKPKNQSTMHEFQ